MPASGRSCMISIALFIGMFGCQAWSVLADSPTLPPALTVSLATDYSSIAVGESVEWYIILTNPSDRPLTDVQILPLDGVWIWPDQIEMDHVIGAHQQMLVTLRAFPREAGDLAATVEISYRDGQRTYTLSGLSDHRLQVTAVRDMVEYQFLWTRTVATLGEPVEALIRIDNRSPFDLAISIDDVAAPNIDIQGFPQPCHVPAEGVLSVPIHVVMNGETSSILLDLEYSWQSPSGQDASEHATLTSMPITVQNSGIRSWMDQAPPLLLAAIFTVFGALVTWSIQTRSQHRYSERLNVERVKGMLETIAFDAKQSALAGHKVAVQNLWSLLSEEGLYRALKQLQTSLYHSGKPDLLHRVFERKKTNISNSERDLLSQVYALWNASECYNNGLDRRWNAIHRHDLLNEAKQIFESLGTSDTDDTYVTYSSDNVSE